MPNKDLPCAGCGAMMWRTDTSLPEGLARCQPCRRANPDYKGAWRPKSYPPRACDICGVTYKPTHINGKYCSRDCHSKRKRDGKRPESPCRACGEAFTPVARKHAFCSPECRKSVAPAIRVVWRQCPMRLHWHTERGGRSCTCTAPPPKVSLPPEYREQRDCMGCGTAMELHRHNLSRLRCDTCLLDERRRYKDKRRALERDAYRADVSRPTIYKRDGYRCKLCGKRLNMKAMAPHPMSPTIDHIVPLARGGTHEPLNVQAAHFLCNSLKGDRGGNEQLLLIG